jgi:purine-nucleoside phosphorylase
MSIEVKINKAKVFLKKKNINKIDVVIVCGSNFSFLSKILTMKITEIEYAKIPGFKGPTIPEHPGRIVYGKIDNKLVALLLGRYHFYEGYSQEEIAFPIRVLIKMGAKNVILTNSVGSLSKKFKVGSLVAIKDHLNLLQVNPAIAAISENIGQRYPDLLDLYNNKLRVIAKKAAKNILADLKEAILAYGAGPCFETEAELKWLKVIGADVVGWSLVPEAIAAMQLDAQVLGLSLITDFSSKVNNIAKIDVNKIFSLSINKQKILQKYFSKLLKGM